VRWQRRKAGQLDRSLLEEVRKLELLHYHPPFVMADARRHQTVGILVSG